MAPRTLTSSAWLKVVDPPRTRRGEERWCWWVTPPAGTAGVGLPPGRRRPHRGRPPLHPPTARRPLGRPRPRRPIRRPCMILVGGPPGRRRGRRHRSLDTTCSTSTSTSARAGPVGRAHRSSPRSRSIGPPSQGAAPGPRPPRAHRAGCGSRVGGCGRGRRVERGRRLGGPRRGGPRSRRARPSRCVDAWGRARIQLRPPWPASSPDTGSARGRLFEGLHGTLLEELAHAVPGDHRRPR